MAEQVWQPSCAVGRTPAYGPARFSLNVAARRRSSTFVDAVGAFGSRLFIRRSVGAPPTSPTTMSARQDRSLEHRRSHAAFHRRRPSPDPLLNTIFPLWSQHRSC